MSEASKPTLKQLLTKSVLYKPFSPLISKWKRGRQRRKMERFYAQFVSNGGLCYDVGANVGNRTDVFRHLGARVIAVEPQTACLDTLRQRFGSDPEVVIVPMGVSNAPGKASLALSDDSSTIASFSPEFRERWRWSEKVQWKNEELVELTTLDELIRKFGVPDFCKIDVEGFEWQVLAGLSQPIPALSFEFNIELIDQTQLCVEKLTLLRYQRFNFSEGESMTLGLAEWVDGGTLMTLLKSRKDPLFWGDVYVLK